MHAKRRALNVPLNQWEILHGNILASRSLWIMYGSAFGEDFWYKLISAFFKCWLREMILPELPFEERSGRCSTSPTSPEASVTIDQVTSEISCARNPAFKERNPIISFARDHLPWAKIWLISRGEIIFACLPITEILSKSNWFYRVYCAVRFFCPALWFLIPHKI